MSRRRGALVNTKTRRQAVILAVPLRSKVGGQQVEVLGVGGIGMLLEATPVGKLKREGKGLAILNQGDISD